jgi:hypothetical protein
MSPSKVAQAPERRPLNGFESAAMKRLSRHTVVVLVIALLASAAGSTLAVVAFGQGDGTTPTSGYTQTTTASSTSTLSPYATTPSTTPASTTPTKTSSTTPTEATSTNGANPVRKHGTTVPANNGGPPPSRATRKGPSHLAFTGGEPLYVGFFGVALMAGGLMLHRRRRAATGR